MASWSAVSSPEASPSCFHRHPHPPPSPTLALHATSAPFVCGQIWQAGSTYVCTYVRTAIDTTLLLLLLLLRLRCYAAFIRAFNLYSLSRMHGGMCSESWRGRFRFIQCTIRTYETSVLLARMRARCMNACLHACMSFEWFARLAIYLSSIYIYVPTR